MGLQQYALGAAVSGGDFLVAEHVTVLHPASNTSISLIADPNNEPVPEAWLNLTGTGGGKCTTPTACPGPAGFAISKHMLRLSPSVTHTQSFDIVAHTAACFRPALKWSVDTYAKFWKPLHPGVRFVDGLGSYSSYLGNLTDPKWKEMGYQTSWDLSGRFFPYMGMFLPPVPTDDTQWLNDVEGTQKPANCSFRSIDTYYQMAQSESFSTLSYFNVFEYGINVQYSLEKGSASKSLNQLHWENASQYLQDNFQPALVTDYACAYHGPCAAGGWHRRNTSAQGSWQKSVVVDPWEGLGYDTSLLSQVQRKLDRLPHFQGLVVDRSDWNQLVNFAGDDGYTWVVNQPGRSFKRSYMQVLSKVRDLLDSQPGSDGNPNVMLANGVGFSWLPFMRVFDGTYSEGSDINAVGTFVVCRRGMRSNTVVRKILYECPLSCFGIQMVSVFHCVQFSDVLPCGMQIMLVPKCLEL
eukprot:m.566494 g.566494  ORF g.566494 m.566494 type:complete len:466 (+) comp22252_c0_seq8:963-2360(+)